MRRTFTLPHPTPNMGHIPQNSSGSQITPLYRRGGPSRYRLHSAFTHPCTHHTLGGEQAIDELPLVARPHSSSDTGPRETAGWSSSGFKSKWISILLRSAPLDFCAEEYPAGARVVGPGSLGAGCSVRARFLRAVPITRKLRVCTRTR